ncbi:hypothetical protein LIER_35067 [Lithospermum erythrorhizon]|uniref:Uncharacterized protein n=1 Tax=Lithospermum erythrorhizon TaxID=34254 RepID=A0AAV3NJ06_LITER
MKEFNDCLESIDVIEVTSHGCVYTWSTNWKRRDLSVRKLDYVFCNEKWLEEFPHGSVHCLPPGISNHARRVIHMNFDLITGLRPFKYHSFQQEHPSYGMQGRIFNGQWNQEDFILESNLRTELVRVSKAELDLLRSKARLTWLSTRDFITFFFHRSVLASRSRHQISFIMEDDGQLYTDPHIMEDKIIEFYKALFTRNGPLSKE